MVNMVVAMVIWTTVGGHREIALMETKIKIVTIVETPRGIILVIISIRM